MNLVPKSIAASPTERAPDPSAAAVGSESVPAVTMAPPVHDALLPLTRSRPAVDLVRPPLPASTAEIVPLSTASELGLNVPLPITPPVSVTAPTVAVDPPRSRVPPTSSTAPDKGRLPPEPRASVPCVIRVPPEWELAAVSVTVPVPDLVSKPVPPRAAKTVPLERENAVPLRLPLAIVPLVSVTSPAACE